MSEEAGKTIVVPINDDTRFILGQPNFWYGPIAERLRVLGHEILHKAEAEQAAGIIFLLEMQEKHGEDWKAYANAYLKGETAAGDGE